MSDFFFLCLFFFAAYLLKKCRSKWPGRRAQGTRGTHHHSFGFLQLLQPPICVAQHSLP